MSKLHQRRIANELRSIDRKPSKEFVVLPSEKYNEWYFMVIGSPDTVYHDGHYLGKIIFSKDYPKTPIDFVMLTPSGRFNINKKICLSNSGFHPEKWSMSWTVNNSLIGFISIMNDDKDIDGVNHMLESKETREKMCKESFTYNIEKHPMIYADIVEKLSKRDT